MITYIFTFSRRDVRSAVWPLTSDSTHESTIRFSHDSFNSTSYDKLWVKKSHYAKHKRCIELSSQTPPHPRPRPGQGTGAPRRRCEERFSTRSTEGSAGCKRNRHLPKKSHFISCSFPVAATAQLSASQRGARREPARSNENIEHGKV